MISSDALYTGVVMVRVTIWFLYDGMCVSACIHEKGDTYECTQSECVAVQKRLRSYRFRGMKTIWVQRQREWLRSHVQREERTGRRHSQDLRVGQAERQQEVH